PPRCAVSKQEKALVSVSRALSAGVRKYGRAILCSLAMALKTTRLYASSHQNVTLAMDELEDFITSFVRLESKCQITRADERLFLNEVLIKVDFGSYDSFQHVLTVMTEHDIGEMTFQQGLERKEREALVSLFHLTPADPSHAWEDFDAALAKQPLPHVSLTRHRHREAQETGGKDGKSVVISAYFQAISAMDAALEQARAEKPMSLKRLRRAIQPIVDLNLHAEKLTH